MSINLTIIIPTKDRAPILSKLLESIRRLEALEQLRPEIIVSDNNSQDGTRQLVQVIAKSFPLAIRLLTVSKPGKSAAMNAAVRVATGDMLAFLDDDVIVSDQWLRFIESFCHEKKYQAGQGRILLQSPEAEDPVVHSLMHRYRTIPSLDFGSDVQEVHSLNGANFIVSRRVLESVGPFDERLGPGASGTSEDVEFARRLNRADIRIGFIREATVYHRVDRERLTAAYFKHIHRLQGSSRLLIKNRGTLEMLLNLGHAFTQFGFYALLRKERKKYRSKGRIYHYLGMLEAKWNGRIEK